MEIITKKDLDLLRSNLIEDIEKALDLKLNSTEKVIEFDWLKSRVIRKLMNISPATLQNLRITGKIRYKKIMGSYYYNKHDLQKLFEDVN
jgi:hypothetical protein